jgi:hypothetical protein
MVKRRFGIEMFPATAGTAAEREWIDFFSQINTRWLEVMPNLSVNTRKGIVRIRSDA